MKVFHELSQELYKKLFRSFEVPNPELWSFEVPNSRVLGFQTPEFGRKP